MKVDFAQNMTMLDGEPMRRSITDEQPATLAWVSITALLADSDDSVDAKVRAFSLAKRINEALGPVDLTPEEVIVVRDRIGKVFKSVTVVARAVEMLNG